MSIENMIMAEMAKKGLGRPAGKNPEWTLLPPFEGKSNEALWPSKVMPQTKDGIKKGCDVTPANIQGRGAFYDLVVDIGGQAVFVDIKGVRRAPFYTWNLKWDLYVGREGRNAYNTAIKGKKGMGQDYILVVAWLNTEGDKPIMLIRAFNVTKAVRHAEETATTEKTSCVIWGTKTIRNYTYNRIRFCPAGQKGWQEGWSSKDHHEEVSSHMTDMQVQSEELIFSAENMIKAITQVL